MNNHLKYLKDSLSHNENFQKIIRESIESCKSSIDDCEKEIVRYQEKAEVLKKQIAELEEKERQSPLQD